MDCDIQQLLEVLHLETPSARIREALLLFFVFCRVNAVRSGFCSAINADIGKGISNLLYTVQSLAYIL